MCSIVLIYPERELVAFVRLLNRWLTFGRGEGVLFRFLLWQFLPQESCSLSLLTNLIDRAFDHAFIIIEATLAFEADYLLKEGVFSEFVRVHVLFPIEAVERRLALCRLGGQRCYRYQRLLDGTHCTHFRLLETVNKM